MGSSSPHVAAASSVWAPGRFQLKNKFAQKSFLFHLYGPNWCLYEYCKVWKSLETPNCSYGSILVMTLSSFFEVACQLRVPVLFD